jgi:hypothetical protein
MTTAIRLPVLLAGLIAFGSLLAQTPDETDKPPKLFESDDVLAITLTAPWDDLVKNDENENPYPATIEYRDPGGNIVTHQGTVERRGLRRNELCQFPPIRLRFEKEAVKGSMFRGQKSLKLVTHCKKADRYDQYYRLEMLAYRMYNLITDYSFRVRPLDATYVDSGDGKTYDRRFAFVIEDDSDVAKRHGLEKLELNFMMPNRFDDRTSSQMSLFQLMIGNLDWSALRGQQGETCCHNVKLVAPEPFTNTAKAYPVAYDFDFSGLVNAPYAVPPEGLGVKSVTQRLYRGYCLNDQVAMPEVRQQFIDFESAIMNLVLQDDMLDKRTKKKAADFLEKFFEMIKDDDDFERNVVKKCRK